MCYHGWALSLAVQASAAEPACLAPEALPSYTAEIVSCFHLSDNVN